MKKISLSDLLFFFTIFIFFTIGSSAILNSNLMVHIRAGEWMIDNKTILNHDIFSYTFYGADWTNMNWLFQLISAVIYRILGLHGLSLLIGLVFGLSYILVLQNIVTKTGNKVILFFMFFFGIIISTVQWIAIPNIFNIIFVVAVYLALGDVFRGKKYPLLLIPFVELLWVNINYDFYFGLMMVFIYFLGILFEKIIYKKNESYIYVKKIITIFFLSAAASFVNPYFWHVYTKTYSLWAGFITEKSNEMNTIDFGGYGKTALIFFIITLFLIMSAMRKNREESLNVDIKNFFIFCFWQYNFLYSQKYITIYLLITIMFLADIIGDIKFGEKSPIKFLEIYTNKFSDSLTLKKNLFKIHKWFIAFTLLAFLILNNRFDSNVNTDFPDELLEGVKYMKEQKITGNGFHSDLHGDLLIWNNYPDYRVFIDRRAEFYDTKFTSNYSKAFLMSSGWENIFTNKTFNYIILKRNIPLLNTLKLMDNWVKVYETKYETILLRKDYYETIKDKIEIRIEGKNDK